MFPTNTTRKFPAVSVRVIVAFFALLGTAIMYITRVNLNIAILSMAKSEVYVYNTSLHAKQLVTVGDFDWSPSQQGVILGSFFYGYLVTQVIGGRLSESCFSPTKLIFVATASSGVINIATPYLARWSYLMFIASRVALGAFQGILYPSFYTLLQKWIPSNERGTYFPFLDAGTVVGMILISATSGKIIVWFSEIGGWPVVFYFSGALALLWSFSWILLVRSSPRDHPFISKDELQLILDDQESEGTLGHFTPCWKQIVFAKSFWAILIVKVTYGIVFDLVTLKVPAYFQDVLHLQVDETGLAFSFLMLGYMVTLFSCGILADITLVHTRLSKLNVRKMYQTISGVMMTAGLAAIPFLKPSDEWGNIILLAACMAGYGFTSGGDLPIVADVSGPLSGTVFAIVNTICSISGFLVPYLVGVFLQNDPSSQTSWNLIYFGCALLTILGTLVFLGMAEAELQTDWYNEEVVAKLLPISAVKSAHVGDGALCCAQSKDGGDRHYNTFLQ